MTRKEYMKSLEDALSPLPEKTREAALNFCQEMLDDRMEDGMDEEAAVAAMESPVTIASRLGAEPGETVDMGNLKLPNREDYLEFARLSDAAMEGLDKALKEDEAPAQEAPRAETQPEQAPQPAPQAPADGGFSDIGQIVRQAMEAARQGIEMGQQAMEQGLEFGQQAMQQAMNETRHDGDLGEYEEKVLTCPAQQLRGVRLNCSNMPIRVTACSGDVASLTYYTSPKDPYDASVQNGILRLEPQGGGRGGVKINLFGFRFLLQNAQPTVTLRLPADALVDLTAHTSNGSVKVSGLAALCQVDAQTSNCRIEIQDTVCKALEMRSSNARLVMQNVSAKQNISAVTSNSRIEAVRTVSGGGMTLKTSNGRLVLSEAAARQRLEAVTSNGHIQADRIAGGAVTLKSSNGSIRGSLRGRQQDYAIDSGTSNGSNSLPKSQAGTYPLSVHTSNGSIHIDFEG